MNKIDQFIKRNKIRNSKLYKSGLIEGEDYIICPESKERLIIIRSDYITKVLEMTVEEYDKKYPNVQKRCQAHKNNIRSGLRQIDPVSGLTKYELSQQKARAILATPDSNGITGYKRKGQKTRATHMNNVDEYGRNGYSQSASVAIIKGNNTKAEKGLITFDAVRPKFHRYKTIVTYLTERHRKEITAGYITGLAGKHGAWHIDHKFSILRGFQEKISPSVIGHRNNLEMKPWKENISKHSKCSIDLNTLLSNCNYTLDQSHAEYNKIMDIILEDLQNNIPPNAAYLLERYYETNIC